MDGDERLRRFLGFWVWCAALVGGTTVVHALGNGALAAPPADPMAWTTWLEGRDPLVATMALLRLLVLLGCWYLVGVTVIGLLARVVRAGPLLRLADAVTLPPLRRLFQQTLGAALATGLVVSLSTPGGSVVPAPAELRLAAAATEDDADPAGTTPDVPGGPARSADDGSPSVTLRGLPSPPIRDGTTPGGDVDEHLAPGFLAPDATSTPPDPTRPPARLRPPATALLPWQVGSEPGVAQERGGGSDPVEPTELTESAESAESANEPPAPALDPGLGPTSLTVRTGESLWRIASDQLEQVLGRSPSDAEVVPYWRELIERNRDRLPDRDNPDLILPGQEVLLPAVLP